MQYLLMIYTDEGAAEHPGGTGSGLRRVHEVRRGDGPARRARGRRAAAPDHRRDHGAGARGRRPHRPTVPSPRPRNRSAATTWSSAPTSTRRSRSRRRSPARGSGRSRCGRSGRCNARRHRGGRPGGVDAAVARAFREEWGRVVATLIRVTGDWDLAEECAQDAFATAVTTVGDATASRARPARGYHHRAQPRDRSAAPRPDRDRQGAGTAHDDG